MMKKTLILAGVLAMTFTSAIAAENTLKVSVDAPQQIEAPKTPECQLPPKGPDFRRGPRPDFKKGPGPDFEKRLKLTDKQKAKAEDLRKQGHEEMKPIMEAIKAKHQEIDAVKRSRIAVQEQEARIDVLNKDIKDLKAKAHELHKQNMKDFESILTKKQKKELKKMKEEGRKKFEQNRKEHRPPCNCGCAKKNFPHPPVPPMPQPEEK